MGIYSSNLASNASVVTIEAQQYHEDMEIMEAAFTAVIESQENWNCLMKAVGCHELAVMESTGSEVVYEGANLHDFFAAVKKFFLTVIAKIKGIFNQFITKIDSFLRSDKEFIKKYQTKIAMGKTNIPSSFSVKGYKFEGVEKFASELDTIYGQASDTPDTAKAPTDDERKSALDSVRGHMMEKDSVESKEFSKDFKEFLYGEKEELESSYIKGNIGKFIEEIEGAKDTKAKAKKNLDASIKSINKFITQLNKLETEAGKAVSSKASDDDNTKNSGLVASYKAQAEIAKSISEIFVQSNGMFLTALKSRNRQDKAVCVKVISFAEKTPKNESYSYQTESFGEVVYQ